MLKVDADGVGVLWTLAWHRREERGEGEKI